MASGRGTVRHNNKRPAIPTPSAVRVERIGADGDGIAHLPDGTRLYVPGTLPGEVVTAHSVRRRGEGWLALPDVVAQPSSDRVAAPCRAFGSCGGCVLQHWGDAPYRAWKKGLLTAALRAAGYTLATEPAFVAGRSGERRRLDFAIRRSDGRLSLGLHRSGSNDVADLTDCLVLHPTLQSLIRPLRDILRGLTAVRRAGSVIVNLLDAGPDLLLRSDQAPTAADRVVLAEFARAHGLPRVSWVPLGRDVEPETICLLRPPVVNLSGFAVQPPPGGFLQASKAGERAVVASLLAALPPHVPSRARIAELYAGCGTLTFALARHARVTAWEGDSAAVGALRRAVNQSGVAGRVEVVARDLARQPVGARELAGFLAVVLDPPYAGAAAQVAEIAAAKVPLVIYVGCNPATLGRDARMLRAAGYQLAAATAIDQFLWSARVECVCVFRRPKDPGSAARSG
jgi:23S rRNA (uracil1939-C5)-methyltransferase